MSDFISEPIPEAWSEIIDERFPVVSTMLSHGGIYLAGGLLRTLISDEPLSPEKTDIDLFFQSPYLYNKVKTWMEKRDDVFVKVFQCPEDKLATFVEKETGWKYQCIAVDFYPTVLDVVASFDFTTTCFGTDGKSLVYHKFAIADTMDKVLRWNKITLPASSMRRMMKYARKGFTMPEREYQLFAQSLWEHSPDIIDFNLVYVD